MEKELVQRRHEELIAAGWVRRFTAEEPRLSEVKQLYESMGMEVLVEPGMVGEEDDCKSCFSAEGFEDRYKTIYTRGEGRPGQGIPADLFDTDALSDK
jgi:hypothetical protein